MNSGVGSSQMVGEGDVRVRKFRADLTRALSSWRMRGGLAMTALFVVLVVLGPFLAPHDPAELVGSPYQPPSSTALLGTDYLGEDVFSRVLWGGRSVLWMSITATVLCMVAGTAIGLLAAYSRGDLDDLLMRVMDVVLAVPLVVFVLLFVAMFGRQAWLIVLLVAIGWAPQVARIARGAALEVVHLEYVEAAEVLGVPRRRILAVEILPNIISPLMVEFSLRLTYAIGLIAAISFLGFGIQPPNADWGLMINQNRNGLTIQPWGVVAPVLCIAVFTVGTNLIAEGFSRSVAGIDRTGSTDWLPSVAAIERGASTE